MPGHLQAQCLQFKGICFLSTLLGNQLFCITFQWRHSISDNVGWDVEKSCVTLGIKSLFNINLTPKTVLLRHIYEQYAPQTQITTGTIAMFFCWQLLDVFIYWSPDYIFYYKKPLEDCIKFAEAATLMYNNVIRVFRDWFENWVPVEYTDWHPTFKWVALTWQDRQRASPVLPR